MKAKNIRRRYHAKRSPRGKAGSKNPIVSSPTSPPPLSTSNDISSFQAHPISPPHSLVSSPPDKSHSSHQSPTYPISPPHSLVSTSIALSPPCIDDSQYLSPSHHKPKAFVLSSYSSTPSYARPDPEIDVFIQTTIKYLKIMVFRVQAMQFLYPQAFLNKFRTCLASSVKEKIRLLEKSDFSPTMQDIDDLPSSLEKKMAYDVNAFEAFLIDNAICQLENSMGFYDWTPLKMAIYSFTRVAFLNSFLRAAKQWNPSSQNRWV